MSQKNIKELYPKCLSSVTRGSRVIWGITNKCNLQCKHCAAKFKETISPPIEKYFKTMEEMIKTNVDTIYFSGGEPLLFEDIYELIKFGKKLGVTVTLGTNGTLLNEEVVKKLRYSKIDKVFVSLDHWEKEKHDWLRGEGAFEKTINGIKLLKKYGIRVRVDSIIWKQNYKAIEKLVEFCEKLNVDEVMFAWPVKVGLAEKNYFQIFPPKEEYFSTGEKLKTIQKCSKVKVSYHRFKYFSKNCKDCPGGEKIFYINPEGRISPCFWISCLLDLFSEKTVFEEKFLRLINDKSLEYFRKEKKKRYKEFGPRMPCCMYYREWKLLLEGSFIMRIVKLKVLTYFIHHKRYGSL